MLRLEEALQYGRLCSLEHPFAIDDKTLLLSARLLQQRHGYRGDIFLHHALEFEQRDELPVLKERDVLERSGHIFHREIAKGGPLMLLLRKDEQSLLLHMFHRPRFVFKRPGRPGERMEMQLRPRPDRHGRGLLIAHSRTAFLGEGYGASRRGCRLPLGDVFPLQEAGTWRDQVAVV